MNAQTVTSDTIILVNSNGMGKAAPELRQKLLLTYLTLLDENNQLPNAICFYTEGVHLVAEGSPALNVLGSLESKGVRLIVCSTCLNYFNLMDRIKAGIPGGMADIVEAQFKAKKVITL